MNQPVKGMSFEELLKVMLYKLEESKEVSPQLELKKGNRVKIKRYWEGGMNSSFDGKEGEFIEITKHLNENKVKLDDGTICTAYKVEKITKPKEEKKTLSDKAFQGNSETDKEATPLKLRYFEEDVKETIKDIKEEIEAKIQRQVLGTSEKYIDGLNYAKDVINKRIGKRLI